MASQEQLRGLPAVDHVLVGLAHLEGRFPRRLIVDEVRRVLEATREEIRAGRHADAASIETRVERNLAKLESAFAAPRDQRDRRGAAHQSGARATGSV